MIRSPFGYLSRETKKLRNLTGVPFMTLYAITTQVLQLHRAGFTPTQVRRAILAMHPETMANLKFASGLSLGLKLKDPTLVWKRYEGWVKR